MLQRGHQALPVPVFVLEIWGTGRYKGCQNMPLQAYEDDVEGDVLWGLKKQRTSFNAPTGPPVPAVRQTDVITFGMPSLLP